MRVSQFVTLILPIHEIKETALGDPKDVSTEFGNVELCDPDCTGDVKRLFESTDHAQRALDKLSRAVTSFGACFVASMCGAWLKHRTSMVLRLITLVYPVSSSKPKLSHPEK